MKYVFAVISAALSLLWLSLRALGWWRYAAVLSGTVPDGAASVNEASSRAIALLVVHFAFVLFAAPAALTAVALHARDVINRGRRRSSG